jgi:hypothetical protein
MDKNHLNNDYQVIKKRVRDTSLVNNFDYTTIKILQIQLIVGVKVVKTYLKLTPEFNK